MSIKKASGFVAGFTGLFLASASLADDVLQLEDGSEYSASELLEAIPSIRQVPVEVPWEDVITVTIDDPILKRQAENFLDLLERSEFPFNVGDDVQYLSGQYILGQIRNNQSIYQQAGAIEILEENGFMIDGRFLIGSHDRAYDGEPVNGSHTIIVTLGDAQLPVTVLLGEQYQRGAMQYSADGALAPVTAEGVLANELAHLSGITDNQQGSMQVEDIIAGNLGAVQRSYELTFAEYVPEVHGGYVSLIDNMFFSEPETPENGLTTPRP